MPRVIVTGASGLLGRAVMKVLQETDWDIIGLAYSRVKPGLLKCDLTNSDEVTALLERERPDFILHIAAERGSAAETQFEETCKLNVAASGHLSKVAGSIGCRMIYASTAYVFDGTGAPYKEMDETVPLNKYGISKLEGEKAVLKANQASCVFRLPTLYGPVERLDECPITNLLKPILDMEEKSVSHYELRYPSYVFDIARIMRDLIKSMMKDDSIRGIFQWSGKQRMTKYDMVVEISKAFSLPHRIIPDTNNVPCSFRPYDIEMDRSRFEALGISHHTEFQEAIKECLLPWMK